MLTSINVAPILKTPLVEVKRSLYFVNEFLHTKLRPIPMIRKNVVNNHKKFEKFVVEGNKYFSKVSASGENSQTILKNIRKSRNLKLIKKFEFDPYLCEQSNIKPLSLILKKLQDTTSSAFSFRRVDSKNETNVLIPLISRMRKLINLKYEFPKTSNIDDRGLINLERAFAKTFSVKKTQASYIEMQDVSEQTFSLLPKIHKKRIFVDEVSVAIIRRGMISDTQDQIFPNGKECQMSQLKKLTFHCGIKAGWFSTSPEAANTSINFLKSIQAAPILSCINLRFRSTPITDEALATIAEIFPKIPLLRYLSLEFSNCRVSDTEICSFAQSLRNMSQVEQFTLKIIQYPNLFENCILYFATTISKLANFKKFDLYFRRLSTEEEILKELVEKLSVLDNTKCGCHKQSLHIYRD